MAETAYFGETIKSGAGMFATSDLSAKQFYGVTVGTSGVSLAGAGAAGVKVLTNKPISGDPCALVDLGETKAVAGAAITKGATVMTNASGQFIAFVDDGVNVPVGQARQAASNSGDVITIFVWPTPASQKMPGIQDTVTALASGGRPGAPAMIVGWNRLSVVANAADSVVMPPAVAGSQVVIINDGAAAAQVFGAGSDTIDAIAGATGVVLTNAKRAIFYCLTAPRWQSLEGVKSV